jgi:hypothetical protein
VAGEEGPILNKVVAAVAAELKQQVELPGVQEVPIRGSSVWCGTPGSGHLCSGVVQTTWRGAGSKQLTRLCLGLLPLEHMIGCSWEVHSLALPR